VLEPFESLLELPAWPASIDLVQTSSRWGDDPESRSLRDVLDARLFASMLRGDEITIRRIAYLEPPRGADGTSHREHRTWIAGLVRDLYQLDMPRYGPRARYRLRQLIRQQTPNTPTPLVDGWNSPDNSAWSVEFESLWQTPGCIESNVPPVEVPHGPPADRDPRWYLWH
jgi:hypothetical protein